MIHLVLQTMAARIFGAWATTAVGLGIGAAGLLLDTPDTATQLARVLADVGVGPASAQGWASIIVGVAFLLTKRNLGLPRLGEEAP